MEARDAVIKLAIYKITHTTAYYYGESVPVCHNEVHLTPRNTHWQTCLHSKLSIKPHPDAIGKREDYFGNTLYHFSIQEGHRRLSVSAHSRVDVRLRELVPVGLSPAWETVRDSFRGQLDADRLEAVQYRLSLQFFFIPT